MSIFNDTTGWQLIDKWLIERPERMHDRGFRLAGQHQSIWVELSALRATTSASWDTRGAPIYIDDDGNYKEGPATDRPKGHVVVNEIFAEGALRDDISLFSLDRKGETTSYDRLEHIRIVPIDMASRNLGSEGGSDVLTGLIFLDTNSGGLTFEGYIDEAAFTAVFERIASSAVPLTGHLSIRANLFQDEVEASFIDRRSQRCDFGLLVADDDQMTMTPAGVERLSVSTRLQVEPMAEDDTAQPEDPQTPDAGA